MGAMFPSIKTVEISADCKTKVDLEGLADSIAHPHFWAKCETDFIKEVRHITLPNGKIQKKYRVVCDLDKGKYFRSRHACKGVESTIKEWEDRELINRRPVKKMTC